MTISIALTDVQYDQQREELRRLYGDSNVEAVAKRDQALAELFHRSGWTQERLAQKEGKAQSWVAQRLRFGRFLNFITTVINEDVLPRNLTERRFRQFWSEQEKHGGNDRQRFQATLDAIRSSAITPSNAGVNNNIAKRIIEAYADGKWHDEEKIVDRFSDVAPELIYNALAAVCKPSRTVANTKGERERHGRGHRVRLIKQDCLISYAEIKLKLLPLIEGLVEEGKKNMATMSPGTVARLAALLKRQIDTWEQ